MTQKFFFSKLVQPGNEEYVVFTPPLGKKCIITRLDGNLRTACDCSCLVYWKFNDPDETLLFTLKGTDDMTVPIDIPDGEIDGVRSIGVALDNPTLIEQPMSVVIVVEVE